MSNRKFDNTTLTFGSRGLFPRREITTKLKTVQTPAKALPVKHAIDDRGFSHAARGVAEIYQEVDAGKLRELGEDETPGWLNTLSRKVGKASEDDLVCVFLAFKETRAITPLEARQLVQVVATFSDVLTVPLQPRLVREMLRDEEDREFETPFQAYRTGIERVLMEAAESESEKPVMGTLPPTGFSRTERLLRLYDDHDVEAFCLNFAGRRVTAARQVTRLRPLIEHIGQRRLHEDVILYGINIDATGPKGALGFRPAMNFAPAGMGFDIIGEDHTGLSVSPEVMGGEDDPMMDEDFVRLFDREAIALVEVPLDELEEFWPEETGISPDEYRAGSTGVRRRIRKLVNAEQLALALRDLREAIDADEDVFEYLRDRVGVTPEMRETFQEMRASFENGRGPNVAGN